MSARTSMRAAALIGASPALAALLGVKVGFGYALVYYFVFSFFTKRFDLATPRRVLAPTGSSPAHSAALRGRTRPMRSLVRSGTGGLAAFGRGEYRERRGLHNAAPALGGGVRKDE